MSTIPSETFETVYFYLYGTGVDTIGAGDGERIDAAIQAETAAQARVCRVSDPVPADLTEALCRRVARNLAVRNVPLGFQASMSEAAVAVTRIGTDPEVRRLEAPFRKLPVG